MPRGLKRFYSLPSFSRTPLLRTQGSSLGIKALPFIDSLSIHHFSVCWSSRTSQLQQHTAFPQLGSSELHAGDLSEH
ncbi:hypothetical protein NDU88_010543 [Pleurodeles waltl]|uniref:Uncharacterized protein n=1 Tax=Pleurodeles waltl TaxID=8319 RepID=A0AAV7PV59_PLEWA|nr:hypothetical protein NDU88_010543 [Pleurodeles waltl]